MTEEACVTVQSYGHPGSHAPSIITQDELNRFVTDAQITGWDAAIADLATHEARTDDPHNVTKLQVELGSCDDTSDVDKPISTAQQTAHDLKADASSVSNVDNTSDVDKPVSTDTQTALDLKMDTNAGMSKLIASDGAPDPAFSIDATGLASFPTGTGINEFSVDGTMAGDSDDAVPTEKAVKQFVEDKINGLNQVLTFGGGSSGDVSTMTLVDGIVTAVTTVA